MMSIFAFVFSFISVIDTIKSSREVPEGMRLIDDKSVLVRKGSEFLEASEMSHVAGEYQPAKYIRSEHPDTDFEFIDLGISGDQTINLVARLQADFIDIQPDLVSIHIGINDTWHRAETRDLSISLKASA